MEVLVLLVIVVVVVLWASAKRKTRRQSVQRVETNIPDPEVIVTVRTSPSGSFDDPDTGSIIPAQHGGWILNPKSTFPLTVYGIDQSTANECKRLLDEGYSKGTYDHARSLLPIIARSNLRCREIDEYVATHKPRYLKKIAELKRSSPDWASASERDQEDLLETFREEAIESLDVRPYCDLVTLFEGEPADITLDDALIDRFGDPKGRPEGYRTP